MRLRVLALLLVVGIEPVAAGSFDGDWDTVVQCPREPAGGDGYVWRLVSSISGGRLHGQYGVPGQSPSASFDGTVGPDGVGLISVRGISGGAQFNIANARGGSPISYEATVRLAGRKGSGERSGGRVCRFTFTRR